MSGKISSTIDTYSRKYQKEKGNKALNIAKRLERKLIEEGKRWVRIDNRTLVLRN
ncbi:hypothetical protein [Tenacibaculum sp. SZ-18]|uniref:hypothetical protein n=1 Tax=Tenacibaculum sp. SZ-18 TaxID=754423 RepID=UPI0012FD0699|nr:hypothetical protein [Tenacibaculum sp. SZ-18]